MRSVVIIGKPNSGKSLLFNRLTGLKQKVANFPGATVELKRGRLEQVELVDYPGVYSLTAVSQDEKIAIDGLHQSLHDEKVRAIICTLDVTKLERSLVFGLQAQKLAFEHNKPIIFALNMIDELKEIDSLNLAEIAAELGSPIYAISAKKLTGLDHFKKEVLKITQNPENYLITKTIASERDAFKRAREVAIQFNIKDKIIIKNQTKLDGFFLHSFFGGIAFFAIMAILFQSIFTWSEPLMDLIENSLLMLSNLTVSHLPAGALQDFMTDAVFGGLGSFLVFVPQIMVLTFIIGILEDSGYLVRAALICHRPLSFFGLTGKSFIPYLSGFACAIPAMMAARTIESPKKRLLTLLTIPLMPCSARLPVYALFITAFIPDEKVLGGVLTYRGLSFFALYFFGLALALILSSLMQKMTPENKLNNTPFMIELPPYRLPHWRPLIARSLQTAWSFIAKAGPIIFTVTVMIWLLSYFPHTQTGLQDSYLAMIGKFINPIFAPLGIDWRYGVAIITSFLAREVFVGVLGTLFGVEGADENISSLADNIQADGLAFASGIAMLVFYAVALQCVSTVAILKKETGSSKIAWSAFAGYGLLAYLLAAVTHLILS